MEGASKVAAENDYAQDGSVDLKGNPVLRSKRGAWFACYFIVVYEACERMAYHGVSANLVLYLTRKLHQGTVSSVRNVTNWVGTGFLMPVLGAFVADAYLGRYWTFVFSAAIYFLGMCLLTTSVSVPSLRPPPCGVGDQGNVGGSCRPASGLQLGVFFTALYVVAFGSGGTKPNISTIGADQFDDFDAEERAHKISFFNWWFFSTFLGSLFAHIILVFIQDNVGWTVGYGIPTASLLISVLIFLAGTPFYRHKAAQGSPLTRMARVVVAAVRKRGVDLRAAELHELEHEEYAKGGKFRILPTESLRFLNRAAADVGPRTPWALSTVTEVEETKQMLRLIPVWLAQLVPSAVDSQVNTLFVKQGTTLDRHVGRHFQIPPASLTTFVTVTMLVSIVLYDRYLVKAMQRWTKNPRGIPILTRIGAGLVLQILAMGAASATENRRLRAAREHGVVQSGREVPCTIFVLLPQFVLMGLADSFTVVGKTEFFYNQAPESMKSLGSSFSLSTFGVGNFLSSAILTSVADLTKRRGRKGWILNNLNASRLDYYYALLGLLGFFNLMFFVYVSKLFVHKAEIFDDLQVEAPSKEDYAHREGTDK